MCNLKKNDANEFIYKNRNRLTGLENELMITKGEECGGDMVKEFGIDMYILLYLKWITKRDLLHSTGNSTQYSITTLLGKEFLKEEIHVYEYNWITLLYTWN